MMTFFKVIFIAVIVLFADLAHGQEVKNNSLYLRTVDISELGLGYERMLGENVGMAVEAGYKFRLFQEVFVPWNPLTFPVQYAIQGKSYRGPSFRHLVSYYVMNPFHENKYQYKLSLASSYRFLESGLIIHDEGKFGGSNLSPYSEYTENQHEFGISLFVETNLSGLPLKFLNLYGGMGVLHRQIDRTYSVEGLFDSPRPSDRTEELRSNAIAIYMGLKIDLFRR